MVALATKQPDSSDSASGTDKGTLLRRIGRKMRSVCNRARSSIISRVLNVYALHFLKSPTILSVEGTIDLLRTERCSLSRFGDGEMIIMRGGSIGFQDASPRLAEMLKQVLKERVEGLLVALPPVFGSLAYMTDDARSFYENDLVSTRYEWYKAVNLIHVHGNSFVSRFYQAWANKDQAHHTVARLRTIWAGRDVVFIEGEESRLGVGNDLFLNAQSIRRILAPKKNAFDRYDDLLAAGAALEKEALLILALGPTATVMSRSFHLLGYQALDLGHVDIEYEWLRMGATTKVPVPSKHVNEVPDAGPICVVADPEYQNQIIDRIL